MTRNSNIIIEQGGRLVAKIRVGRVESEENTISCDTTVQAGMTKISL